MTEAATISATEASSVLPRDAQEYLRHSGWKPQDEPYNGLRVFDWPDALDQAFVPFSTDLPDYGERMRDLVLKLASMEGRPPTQIVTDLRNWDADVLRFRLAPVSPKPAEREAGSVLFSTMRGLVDGIREAVLSAGQTVLRPRLNHAKLAFGPAQRLLDKCRFNQTEVGSYVVSVSCPLNALAADEPEGADRQEERVPYARRTTRTLYRSMIELDEAIQRAEINRLVDTLGATPNSATISANLCNALLDMRPAEDGLLLSISPHWAPKLAAPADFARHRSVRFTQDEFEAVEEIYRQLKPDIEPEPELYLAWVDELKGTENEEGRREGDVIVRFFNGERMVKARAHLNVDQYAEALRSHNPARPVWIGGRLHYKPRVSRLEDVDKVSIFDPTAVDPSRVTTPAATSGGR